MREGARVVADFAGAFETAHEPPAAKLGGCAPWSTAARRAGQAVSVVESQLDTK
jgi:hypothetical protein